MLFLGYFSISYGRPEFTSEMPKDFLRLVLVSMGMPLSAEKNEAHHVNLR